VKITPQHDLSWYIKWTASILLLIAMSLTSVGNSEPWNLILHLIGVLGWLYVGILWHDRALIFINSIASFIFLSGLLRWYFNVV
jgi:predicted membrane protein